MIKQISCWLRAGDSLLPAATTVRGGKIGRSGRLRPAKAWAAAALGATLLSVPLGTGVARAASVYPSNAPVVGIAATPDGKGYWQVASDGGVFNFGDAPFYGSMGGQRLNAGVVGMAATPDGKGYWEVASDGGIFSFGDARFYGSMGGQHLNAGVVGMAATPDGSGYWLAAADGGVFSFGDARFYGSMGGQHLNAGVVGMAATPDGSGYWLAAADGGVFSFGDARFYGSMGGHSLNDPVTGIAVAPNGGGYWLTAADGGVFSFGNARFAGSMSGKPLAAAVNSITAVPDGSGYWLAAVDGGVFSLGTAAYDGRASYTPPRPTASSADQLAANLASGWRGLDYHGVNLDYWRAPSHPQYWCSDFATYVWQNAGVSVPTYPGVSSFVDWARRNGKFSTDTSLLQVGDVVFYAQHVGVVIQVQSNGTVVTADGDFGGTGSSQAAFASTSHVKIDSFNPRYGQGAAGSITGIGLIS